MRLAPSDGRKLDEAREDEHDAVAECEHARGGGGGGVGIGGAIGRVREGGRALPRRLDGVGVRQDGDGDAARREQRGGGEGGERGNGDGVGGEHGGGGGSGGRARVEVGARGNVADVGVRVSPRSGSRPIVPKSRASWRAERLGGRATDLARGLRARRARRKSARASMRAATSPSWVRAQPWSGEARRVPGTSRTSALSGSVDAPWARREGAKLEASDGRASRREHGRRRS